MKTKKFDFGWFAVIAFAVILLWGLVFSAYNTYKQEMNSEISAKRYRTINNLIDNGNEDLKKAKELALVDDGIINLREWGKHIKPFLNERD